MRAILISLVLMGCGATADPPVGTSPEPGASADGVAQALEPPPAPAPRPPRALPAGPHPRLREFVARIDDDSDGRIDPEEHQRWGLPSPGFAQLDSDGDGFLSIEELDAAIDGHGVEAHGAPTR